MLPSCGGDAKRQRGFDMGEPRIKAKLWVQMALRLGDGDGRPGAVLRRGDPDAGGVLVVLRGREGLSVLSQVRAGEGDVAWMQATGAGAGGGGGGGCVCGAAGGAGPGSVGG